MSTSNFCISAGKPLNLKALSLPDQQFIMTFELPDQVHDIDLRDVLTVKPGWSMTLAGGFLPLPDLVCISMRDGSQHQFSVGLFGVVFGHRDFWISRLSLALTQLRRGNPMSARLAQLSNVVSEPGALDKLTGRAGPVRASEPLPNRT
jgi:hypothetical protein